MKGLLRKDLALIKNQSMYAAVIFIIALFMLLNGNGVMFVIAYANIVFIMLGINTLNYDAFDNGYTFLFTLPITRKTYVAEKYVFSLGGLLAGAVCSVLLVAIAHLLGDAPMFTMENISGVLGYSIGAMIFLGILLPVELKFGPEKSRVALIVVMAIVMACVYAVTIGGPVDLSGLLENLSQVHPLVLVGIGTILGVIFLYLSFMISCKIMKQKEF